MPEAIREWLMMKSAWHYNRQIPDFVLANILKGLNNSGRHRDALKASPSALLCLSSEEMMVGRGGGDR
ncbi:MAG TPA: hypothetical protein VFU57_07790, partial [Candidatus Acidoferrales bacterium]|nr:hypothetical protein [Candidatus Acidoferrales bacterium]